MVAGRDPIPIDSMPVTRLRLVGGGGHFVGHGDGGGVIVSDEEYVDPDAACEEIDDELS